MILTRTLRITVSAEVPAPGGSRVAFDTAYPARGFRGWIESLVVPGYLLQQYGAGPLQELERQGSRQRSPIGGSTLEVIERRWRETLRPSHEVSATMLDAIESKGCG